MWWSRGRTLGKGGFGVVSLATPTPHAASQFSLPPVMAVKSAPYFQCRSLLKELHMLALFRDCPNILHCYGDAVTVEAGVLVGNLLLEFASGGSLADRIATSPSGGGLRDPHAIKTYTRSILLGLRHIHERGYAHCDVKPDNILFVSSQSNGGDTEVAKIADFGLAKKAGEKVVGSGIRGTPLYVAPESVLKDEYEPHSDIWALGCTVLEMLTGKFAWDCDGTSADALVSVLYQIGYTAKIPQIPSGLPIDARDFLSKCLVRDPKLRWTADMLLEHPFVSSIDAAEKERRLRQSRRLGCKKRKRMALADEILQVLRECKKTTRSGAISSDESSISVVRQTGDGCSTPSCKKRRGVALSSDLGDYIALTETTRSGVVSFHESLKVAQQDILHSSRCITGLEAQVWQHCGSAKGILLNSGDYIPL